jgi:hypothetical protein
MIGRWSNFIYVVMAFLEADIEEEIYVRQPDEGFRHTDINGEEQVCLLKKSLYGLKQAPKNWNKTITTWLEEYGFSQSKVDPVIYIFVKEGELYVLALYVDDNLIVGPSGSFIVEFKSAFGVRLNVQDLGPLSWLLGVTLERDHGNRIIRIGQHQYVLDNYSGALQHGGLQANGITYGGRCFEQLCGDVNIKVASRFNAVPKLDR